MKRLIGFVTIITIAILTQSNANAEGGFYSGAGLGKFNYSLSEIVDDFQTKVPDVYTDNVGFSATNTSHNKTIFMGYRWSNNWGLEVNYRELGEARVRAQLKGVLTYKLPDYNPLLNDVYADFQTDVDTVLDHEIEISYGGNHTYSEQGYEFQGGTYSTGYTLRDVMEYQGLPTSYAFDPNTLTGDLPTEISLDISGIAVDYVAELDAIDIVAVRWVSLADPLDIFFKFGASQVRAEVTTTIIYGGYKIGLPDTQHYSAIVPILGAGLEYALTDTLKLRAEYQTWLNPATKITAYNAGFVLAY